MGKYARQRQLRGLGDAAQEGTSRTRFDPHAAHPGVDLDLDRERRAAATECTGQLEAPLIMQNRGQAPFQRALGGRGIVESAEQQDRGDDSRPAKLRPLSDTHHRQPSNALRHQAPGNVSRPVSVTVRLDDTDDGSAVRAIDRAARVVAQRIEIDPGPDRPLLPGFTHFDSPPRGGENTEPRTPPNRQRCGSPSGMLHAKANVGARRSGAPKLGFRKIAI